MPADTILGMTQQEILDFTRANPASQCISCVLSCTDGVWAICIGETQSDGAFRHVDFEVPANTVELALRTLKSADPIERATQAKRIAEIRAAVAPAPAIY